MPQSKRKRLSAPGPCCYEQFWDFAEHQLSQWIVFFTTQCADWETHLGMLGMVTWIITSSYSGVGSAEIAIEFWRKAFAVYGIALQV